MIISIGHIHRLKVLDVFIDLHYFIVTLAYNWRLHMYFVILSIGHIQRMHVLDVFIDLYYFIVTIAYYCRLFIANL